MEFRAVYDQMMEAIADIDTQVDSLTGGKSAGKRKVTSDLVVANQELCDNATTMIVGQLTDEKYSDEQRVALYSAIVSGLKAKFEESTSAYVSAIVDTQPEQLPLVTPEEAAVLSTQRSALYQKVKSIVDIQQSLGGEEWDMPKMKRGSSGKRGPRNLSLFTWSLDGEEIDETIGNIAKANGYDKASELTKALREGATVPAEFDTREGDTLTSFTLPNGKVLSGFRDDTEPDEDEEEGDES